MLIYGQRYKRALSRSNSTVVYQCDSSILFAIIDFFVLIQGKVLAVAKPLVCERYNKLNHISSVRESQEVQVFHIKQILCLFTSNLIMTNGYVCEFPNLLEND